MPEGPEIRRLADRLSDAIVGQRVERVRVGLPRLAKGARRLAGARVEAVETRGKALLTRFEGGRVLYSHNQLEILFFAGLLPYRTAGVTEEAAVSEPPKYRASCAGPGVTRSSVVPARRVAAAQAASAASTRRVDVSTSAPNASSRLRESPLGGAAKITSRSTSNNSTKESNHAKQT